MAATTAKSRCRYCKATRANHLVDPDPSLKPRCPGGAGTRFTHYQANGRRSMSYNLEEVAVLKIVMAEAHRYGTVRASNPALRKLQKKFAAMDCGRAVEDLKASHHRR